MSVSLGFQLNSYTEDMGHPQTWIMLVDLYGANLDCSSVVCNLDEENCITDMLHIKGISHTAICELMTIIVMISGLFLS